MDTQQVDSFLMTNSKYFESHQLSYVRERLMTLDESKKFQIQSLQFKDPTMMLVISVIVGGIGIDRFLIGDVGLGVAKLLTCGGLGIWTIVDWFLIMGITKERNLENFNRAIL
ncbi:TM2 domain-containing protein [Flavobacterium sp. CS20]|jgi:TM2 domain-containing membrane protein YozV|uniref:TM2 domain-containing protein n=1 Tax=Flavobacterium sp. CS20 TaxID=2775246 RepID=UPI001B39E570|nr:TM2 domain-containing protein [Flavobacterium sp. CS20]QTY26732.1 TM2 domain-containing protein [Flavobacterium sp. CS20]